MKGNPYEILGISRNASEEEIKKAYKELVKKYHPDMHQNNPLSELAEEKFKEIQEAYEYLIKNKTSSYDSGQYGYSDRTSYSSRSNVYDFQQVRSFINAGRFQEADLILQTLDNSTGEWYFLKAVINARQGFVNQAYSLLAEALRKDPGNPEYVQFQAQLAQFSNRSQSPFGRTRDMDMANDMCCNCLSCLCCLQCCGGCS